MGEFQSLLQIPQHCFLYGDKDWSPRSGRWWTPSGPEGSSGSHWSRCRGVAGWRRLPIDRL